MKKIKKLVSLFAAALLCLMPFGNTTLTAYAAEPVTYYVKYVPDIDEWRYQVGSSWNDQNNHRELYYLKLDIKDGDLVVVNGIGNLELELSAHLSNLTILHANQVNITANGIDHCYVLKNSCAVINSDVTNAYVYGTTVCNFNKNVTTMEIFSDGGVHATVGCIGTVTHLKGLEGNERPYECFNFAANTLSIVDGTLKTDASHYSTTSTAATTANTVTNTDTSATNTTANTPAPSAPAASTTVASGEYDDVPKTGDSFAAMWLLGTAALCFFGSHLLRKEASR